MFDGVFSVTEIPYVGSYLVQYDLFFFWNLVENTGKSAFLVGKEDGYLAIFVPFPF